jgi:beta-galactosidase
VWLKQYPACHLVPDGVYISADVDGTVTVTTETMRPEGTPVAGLSVQHHLFKDGVEVASVKNACLAADISRIPVPVRREGWQFSQNTDTMHVANPLLWDIEDPQCYTCVTELLHDGAVIDREESTFGFRNIEFTTDHGFFLNGRHVKLHGCCEHHDLGALGAAFNRTAMRRKLTILRTMGINAIRTSHNMPAVELMELADEMGFLIMSESFDMWEMAKTTYDYHRFFKEWSERDVASWVRRDRNHPSIIGWSIGNEIYDTHATEHGMEIASMLAGFVRQHDWRNNGYVTQGSNFMQWENAQKCADILKLAGYNYAERLYDEQHAAHPDWMIYGSETSSVVQSRGIYHFPLSQAVLSDDDEQCSALGNTTMGWAARNNEACIIPDRDRDFVAGQFIWTGFDYIGEPTPYNTKNSYFGQFDTAGFAKDSAYIYREAWTDYKTAPFVHVYPYWDFIEGQEIDIRVASNAPKVALFLNGRLVSEKEIDQEHGQELTMNVTLPYEAGSLVAVAYDEQGAEIARDEQKSFGDAAKICLEADKDTLKADGQDLIFVTISAEDVQGNPVENANNRVHVRVTGAGRLLGLDNGDSTDYDPYKGCSRRLFSGKLLAIIGAKTEPGEIHVEVTSPGLSDVHLQLKAQEAPVLPGISAQQENAELPVECPDAEADIPVRRIGFISEKTVFGPENRVMDIRSQIFPANASYQNEIEYRITTVLGIESNLARILSVEGDTVRVECLGDGEFFLRALCKNGTDRYHILNTIRLTGEGLGSAFFNPYEFVTGGLFTVSDGPVHNGIDKGEGFGSTDSWFGFEHVDFGKYGSDTITVPIFANCTTPVKLKIYDGIPGNGGELIGDFTYHKEPIWMVYQPETWKLTKTLKGVHTLVFASADGYDMAGFSFVKPEKETMELSALDYDTIYGDTFTVGAEAVTGIGNNVVLDFGEFDFGTWEPAVVEITGRSALPMNSIHVGFTGDTQTRVLAEFAAAPDYTTRSFVLTGITGKCQVSFTFLPGSDFDFKSFRFVVKKK